MAKIFISFSGIGRDQFAIPFMNFFAKFGFSPWYDQHELFLGDTLKETIIKNGINQTNYCILIVNKTYLNRDWPCKEAKLIFEKLNSSERICLFPLFWDVTKEEIKNSNIDFLLQIKYQFIGTNESVDQIGYQILNKILHDIVLSIRTFNQLDECIQFFKRLNLSNTVDIYNTLTMLENITPSSYKEKTIVLICLIKLLNTNTHTHVLNQLSYLIYDKKKITYDHYKIAESIFIIATSNFSEGIYNTI